jgi:hypothetical protein
MPEKRENHSPNRTSHMGTVIAVGAGIGVALGVVLGVALGNMAFMGVDTAIGVSLGVAIGADLEQRNK